MLSWYALQVKSRWGGMVSTALRSKGYEEFLPVYRACRHSSKQVRDHEVPLFPGYLFCRLNPSERLLPVLTTPGVMRIISVGKTLLPVTEEEIEAVRTVVRSGLAAEPWPFVETGCRIALEQGPLAGLEGMVINAAGTDRLVVSVDLLRRSIAVEIDRRWARCLSQPS